MLPENIIIIAILVTCIIIGLCGNLVVLAIRISKQRRPQRTAHSYLVCHLATADTLYSVTLIFDLHKMIHGNKWMLGPNVCKLYKILQSASLNTTIIFLTIMSYERYLGTCLPLTHRWSYRKVHIIVTATWVYVLSSLIPHFLAVGVESGTGLCYDCNYTPPEFIKGYIVFLLITNYLIPAVLIITCHRLIIQRINKHNKCMRDTKFRKGNTSTLKEKKWYNTSCCFPVKNQDLSIINSNDDCSTTIQANHQQSKKLINMLVVMTLCFVMLFLPMQFFFISFVFASHRMRETEGRVMNFISSLIYFQGCINFIVYSAMDKTFCRDVKRIFKSLFKTKIQNRKSNHRKCHFVNNRMRELSAVSTTIRVHAVS